MSKCQNAATYESKLAISWISAALLRLSIDTKFNPWKSRDTVRLKGY